MTDRTRKKRVRNLKTLTPRRHPTEFFIADDVDAIHYRDELASMEHPFFALKGGDTRVREYVNGNVTVTVRPAVEIGMATIFDKDLWIYCISKMCQAKYDGGFTSRTVRFTAYDFFVTTNRSTSGRSYQELEKALNRLAGTRIETNIEYDESREASGFGLIDNWRVVDEMKGNLEVGMIEVTLPDWLYSAITETRLLKISPDYFRIRKAIDRRLYEIARKHCGNQKEFKIGLGLLQLKIGSTATPRLFKFNIKKLTETNDLPDYSIAYEAETDCVIFTNRNFKRDESDLPTKKRDRSVSESIMREESDEGIKRREQMIQTADEIVKNQAKNKTIK